MLLPMRLCSITPISQQLMHSGRMQVLQFRTVEALLHLLPSAEKVIVCLNEQGTKGILVFEFACTAFFRFFINR